MALLERMASVESGHVEGVAVFQYTWNCRQGPTLRPEFLRPLGQSLHAEQTNMLMFAFVQTFNNGSD